MVSRNCFLNETVGELTLLADLSTIVFELSGK